MHRGHIRSEPIPVETPTLPTLLKSAGYHTAYFQSNPVAANSFGMEKHFDFVSLKATETHSGEVILQESESWLRENKESPVFAYVHFFQPHSPYEPPKNFVRIIEKAAKKVPPDIRNLRPDFNEIDAAAASFNILGRLPLAPAIVSTSKDPRTYLLLYEANILYADSHVSKFFDIWNKHRPGERTIFIITADHGECFGEKSLFLSHAHVLSNSLLHVPLLIHDTANPFKGEVGWPVSHLDLGTTLLTVAGTQQRLARFGRNIFPYPAGESPHDRILLSGLTPQGEGVPTTSSYDDGWALTRGPWRLIYNDSPSFGDHCLMDVFAGEVDPESMTVSAPVPYPAPVLRLPRDLGTRLTIRSFGFHTPYAEQGKELKFSGKVQNKATTNSKLLVRLRIIGGQSLSLGQFTCAPGETIISGAAQLLPDTGHALHAIVEAQDEFAVDSPSTDRDLWERILAFHLFSPIKLSPGLQLIGLTVAPIATPGDRIQVESVWRCLDAMKSAPTVSLELKNKNGEIVANLEHRLYAKLLESGETSLATKVFRPDHRFEETFFLDIPRDLTPGEYEFYIALVGEAAAIPCGELRIAGSSLEALKFLIESEFDVENIPAPCRDDFDSAESERVKTTIRKLIARYPEEGHFTYLMSSLTEEPMEQRRLLLECLTKVPHHMGALSRATKERWGAAQVSKVRALTPKHACDHIFGDIIRLYGFDVGHSGRRPSEYYLRIYWEALGKLKKPYSVDLWPAKGAFITWLIGGKIRPTDTWKIGEAVVDTVRFDYDPSQQARKTESELVNPIAISVYSYWDYAYRGLKEKSYLPVRNLGGNASEKAVLDGITTKEIALTAEDWTRKKLANDRNYRLYNLEDDPWEMENLVNAQTRIFEALREEFLNVKARIQPEAVSIRDETAQTVPASEKETIRQLRSLGYIK